MDFDLRRCLGGTAGLPNFDQCGRNPPPCNPSHPSLCLQRCGRPYISPLHPPTLSSSPVLLSIFFTLFIYFFLSLGYLQASSIFPLAVAACCCPLRWTDGRQGKETQGSGAGSFSLELQEAWQRCHRLHDERARKCTSQAGSVDLQGSAETGICLLIGCNHLFGFPGPTLMVMNNL